MALYQRMLVRKIERNRVESREKFSLGFFAQFEMGFAKAEIDPEFEVIKASESISIAFKHLDMII